jgi:hypothetical protein
MSKEESQEFKDDVVLSHEFGLSLYNPYAVSTEESSKLMDLWFSEKIDNKGQIIKLNLPHFVIIPIVLLVQQYDIHFAYNTNGGVNKNGRLVNSKKLWNRKPTYEKIFVDKMFEVTSKINCDPDDIRGAELSLRMKKARGFKSIIFWNDERGMIYSLYPFTSPPEFPPIPITIKSSLDKK